MGRCVPKNPRTYDFCGCPPCGICFDWVEDQPAEAAQEEGIVEPVVVDGLEQMGRELLGREPTEEERKIIKEAADRVHLRNLNQKIERDKIIEEQRQEFHDRHTAMQAEAAIKDALRKKDAPAPVPVNTVNLDDMDPEKVRELCGATAKPDPDQIDFEKKRMTVPQREELRQQKRWMEEQERLYNRRW